MYFAKNVFKSHKECGVKVEARRISTLPRRHDVYIYCDILGDNKSYLKSR